MSLSKDAVLLKHNVTRSPEWRSVEKAFLSIQPTCMCCGSRTGIQVHHIFPFHYCVLLGRPDLELDHRNLISLCESETADKGENHHLLLGHLDDFESSNLNVVEDVKVHFHKRTAAEIKASSKWQEELTKRLKPFGQMTDQDKEDFKKLMDSTFPKGNFKFSIKGK